MKLFGTMTVYGDGGQWLIGLIAWRQSRKLWGKDWTLHNGLKYNKAWIFPFAVVWRMNDY